MTKIVVLDYGNPLTEQLCKQIQRSGFDVVRAGRNFTAAGIKAESGTAGVILSGGPFTLFADDIRVVDAGLFELDIPLLGLGRGMQVMIHQLGGTVTPAGYQYSPTPSRLVVQNTGSGLFAGLPADMVRPLGFDAKVSALPEGFAVLACGQEVASGDNRPFGAIENPQRRLFGIQYVLDVRDNADDLQVLNNFLDLCR